MNKIITWSAVVILFLGLAFAYISPTGSYLLENRQDLTLSDGTDPVAAPHHYGLVIQSFHENPLNLFYGSTPTHGHNAPEGSPMWNGVLERWVVVALSPFVALEQMSAAWVIISMLLTGLAMCVFARAMNWAWPISLGLGMAWAFSAFVRARAKVHPGFVGLYHLPLICLAFLVLSRGKTWRSIAGAAALLLVASMVSHYFLLMTGFCGLFFLGFYIIQERKRGKDLPLRSWKKSTARLILAVLPALLFNLSNVVFPVPAEMKGQLTQVFPGTGESAAWPHPYLEFFAARPLDYFTGDTGVSLQDIFPLKEAVNKLNFAAGAMGNAHERTNGIRWSLWLILILGSVILIKNRRQKPHTESSLILLFWGLFLFSFCLSLPPSYFANYLSPAVWLNSLISQFRVSSRAGILVHFAVLVLCGLILAQGFAGANAKRRRLFWIFPALVLLEFPPVFNPMPAAQILPRFASLQGRPVQECRLGMSFPYVSASLGTLEFYYFLQQMRGSRCRVINSTSINARDQKLAVKLGLTSQTIEQLQRNDPRLSETLLDTADCLRLDFLVFDSRINPAWQQDVCLRWQGRLDTQGVCLKPRPHLESATTAVIDRCL